MHCNMVLLPEELRPKRGKKDNSMLIAEKSGLSFIELYHMSGVREQTTSVKMFQHAVISYHDKASPGRRQGYNYELSKFPDGSDMMSSVGLVFKPDDFSGALQAWVIDTPFNREKLASCFFLPEHHKFFRVANADIDKEIGDLAISLGFNKTVPERETDIIKKQALEIARIQAELDYAKNKQKGAIAVVEGTAAIEMLEEGFKAKAKAEIFEEYKIEIAAIKKGMKNPKSFELNKKYIEKFPALIEARLTEFLDKRKIPTQK